MDGPLQYFTVDVTTKGQLLLYLRSSRMEGSVEDSLRSIGKQLQEGTNLMLRLSFLKLSQIRCFQYRILQWLYNVQPVMDLSLVTLTVNYMGITHLIQTVDQ